MLEQRKCPVCFSPALWEKAEQKAGQKGRVFRVACPRCMNYTITPEAIEALNRSDFTRSCREWLAAKSCACSDESRPLLISLEVVRGVPR